MEEVSKAEGGAPGEVIPPRKGPIDVAIEVVEDAAMALGFVGRICRRIGAMARRDILRDVREDVEARAAAAKAAAAERRAGAEGGRGDG